MRDPVTTLLEAAAIAGRSTRPPVDRAGHPPVAPTLRCQQCGRRLELQASDGRLEWIHAPSPTDHPDTAPLVPEWAEAFG